MGAFEHLLRDVSRAKISDRQTIESLTKTIKIADIELNSAIIWLRRIIERSIKEYCRNKIDIDSDKMQFFDYLRRVEDQNIIPFDVLNDIHRTRLLGNESAHRQDLDEKDFEIAFLVTIKVIEYVENNAVWYTIGIDVGSTTIVGALSRLQSGHEPQILFKEELESIRFTDKPNALVDALASMISALLKKTDQLGDVNKDYIRDVGIGLPGQVDEAGENLVYAPGLKICNFPIVRRLNQRLDSMGLEMDIRLENDVRCGAIAELVAGNGTHYRNFMVIFIGSGVGGGVVVDRRLVNGSDNIAGECGHTTLEFRQGRPCHCGRTGCLEAYISSYAIERRLREMLNENPSHPLNKEAESTEIAHLLRSLPRHADDDDKLCRVLIDEVGTALGTALGNFTNLLNPEAFLLGGGIIKGYYDLIATSMFQAFDASALAGKTAIHEAKFVTDAPLIGAILLHHYHRQVETKPGE